jgi:hypothetical protein
MRGDPVNGAELALVSVPRPVSAEKTFRVRIRARNTGTSIWQPDRYWLGSQAPQDNGTWGTSRVALERQVMPGEYAEFSFDLRAPSNPGLFEFQWRMVEEHVEWFGEATEKQSIRVD